MKKYNLTATALMCLMASNAFAGGASPFYLGASVGRANVDLEEEQFDNFGICSNATAIGEGCHIGDGGSVGHIYGGIQLSNSIAVEAGYADLGTTASYHYTDPVTITQNTKGLTLAGVYRQRLGKSSPLLAYGKAGVYAWKSEAESVSDHPKIIYGRHKVEDSGVSPMVGAGLEYELNHNISLRAGWDRYMGVGENSTLVQYDEYDYYGTSSTLNTLETDVDVYSAGVNFSFY